MAKKGKKYQDAVKKYDVKNFYDASEALGTVCDVATAKI